FRSSGCVVKWLSSAVLQVALATRLRLLASMISPKSSTRARVRHDRNACYRSLVVLENKQRHSIDFFTKTN
ncbi:MAG: hypothetical protein KGQ60_17505, partial [Planctomycetes bacterium]|nr:hypothetical protein [Planctomycetota bacterium]